MLYVYHGSDQEKSRALYDKLVASLTEKHPEALLVRLDELSFNEEEFQGLIFGQGLFSRRLIVTGNGLCANKEGAVFIEENIQALKDSPNIFIFIERELSKSLANLFLEKAEKTMESVARKQEVHTFNVFGLLDALASRDRKRAWVLYQEARSTGLVPEDIFWRIQWQVKTILLAGVTKTAEEADMKTFPYNKAKDATRNFSSQDLKDLSEKIVNIYHSARRGSSLDLGLEELVLNI